MRFSWDRAKNERNLRLRGLDFADAPAMWSAPMFVRVDDRTDYGETREIGFGLIGKRVMMVGWVQREDDVIHIFTFRKANAREARQYKKFISQEDGHAKGG